MPEKSKVEGFKPPAHKTLLELTSSTNKIAMEAAAHGHDGFFPVQVVVEGSNGKPTVRGQAKAASSDRGRHFTFAPTKERVTVLREKVGQSYSGDWIHEVATREGKKFLASSAQLRQG